MAYANGFYRFEHSYLSRKGSKTRGKSGPFHLAAVASYMSNINKTVDEGIAVNLPVDRGELYSALTGYSNKVRRANGRIAETFVASYDKKMLPEHRREALESFLMAVTFNATIKARAWEHKDDNNPHSHVIVIDEDANGERVAHFGRSGTYRREHSPVKGNPTRWLRKVWQDECNSVLERHGYDFRVDMRSNLERGLAKPQEKIGWQEEVEPELEPVEDIPAEAEELTQSEEVVAPVEIPDPIGQLPPDAPLEEIEEADDDGEITDEEAAMAVIEYPHLETTSQLVRAALEAEHWRRHIVDLQDSREETAERLKAARHRQSAATVEAAMQPIEQLGKFYSENLASKRLSLLQKDDASLKGFEVKLGKWSFKSRTRREAEKAVLDYDSAKTNADIARRSIQEHEYEAQRLKQEADEVERLLEIIDNSLRLYGSDKDVAVALQIHENTVADRLEFITADQVMDAWDAGELKDDEALEALTLLGEQGLLEELESEIADRRSRDDAMEI